MLNMNRVTLIGNAGRKPEVRRTRNGKKIALFSLATSGWNPKNSGEAVTADTAWHRIVVFGSLADVAERYLYKGDPVLVEGRLSYRSFKDRRNTVRSITEIVVAAPRGQLNLLRGAGRPADPAAVKEPREWKGKAADLWHDLHNAAVLCDDEDQADSSEQADGERADSGDGPYIDPERSPGGGRDNA